MYQPASIPDLVAEISRARLQASALDWPRNQPADLPTAYAASVGVRAARIRAGEVPVGYKVGFTNRSIWPIYNVYQPIWGTVWRSTLHQVAADGPNEGALSLAGLCEPRIEPEIIFGLRESPPADGDLAALAASIDWMAHGFEIVHTHFPGWKFSGAQAVADGGLHGLLLVGHPVKLAAGIDSQALASALSRLKVKLYGNDVLKDEGVGAQVLDGPLQALLNFVQALRSTPGAPALQAGDVITTGTLTDAHPVCPFETWHTEIAADDPLAAQLQGLRVRFT
jgi:2-keto-4-pentenoate hydratase